MITAAFDRERPFSYFDFEKDIMMRWLTNQYLEYVRFKNTFDLFRELGGYVASIAMAEKVSLCHNWENNIKSITWEK